MAITKLQQLRMQKCWIYLRTHSPPNNWTPGHPLEILINYASVGFKLKKSTAKTNIAYPLIRFLKKEGFLEIGYSEKNGAGEVVSGICFKLYNHTKERLDFPQTNGKVQSTDGVPDYLKKVVDEACKRLEDNVGSIVEHQLKNKIRKKLKEDSQNDKSIAVWIDGPNISNSSRKAGIQLPIRPLLEELRNHGNIVCAFAFNNLRCSEKILKMYKRMGIVNITCVSPKEEFDTGFDPVDDEIKRIVPVLADIAQIHVVGSMDRHFEPIIAHLQQQGKVVARFQVDEARGIADLQEIGDKKTGIGYTVLRTRKFKPVFAPS